MIKILEPKEVLVAQQQIHLMLLSCILQSVFYHTCKLSRMAKGQAGVTVKGELQETSLRFWIHPWPMATAPPSGGNNLNTSVQA